MAAARHHMTVNGGFRRAARILKPWVQRGHPEALFLRASFSLRGEETTQAFEARRIRMLSQAAELGFPQAMYDWAICLEIGDGVDQDPEAAAKWFEAAARAGHVFQWE
jgi:TPR repeat protein